MPEERFVPDLQEPPAKLSHVALFEGWGSSGVVDDSHLSVDNYFHRH